MEIDESNALDFTKTLTKLGIELFGLKTISKICQKIGLQIDESGSVELPSQNFEQKVENFILEYAKINVSAKITVINLAKKFKIPIPEGLSKKNKISRLLGSKT